MNDWIGIERSDGYREARPAMMTSAWRFEGVAYVGSAVGPEDYRANLTRILSFSGSFAAERAIAWATGIRVECVPEDATP